MLQRALTPARARTSPAGFMRPCAPTILGRAPRGARWLHEIKQDGYRLCARKAGADAALWTRGENEVGGRFEATSAMMCTLPVASCTIDGEAIVRRPDGLSDFHAGRQHLPVGQFGRRLGQDAELSLLAIAALRGGRHFVSKF